MRVRRVPARDGVDHPLDEAVRHDPDAGQSHGTREADRGRGHPLRNGRVGHDDGLAAKNTPQLDLVQVVVAPDENGDRLAVRQDDERLDQAPGIDTQRPRHLLHALFPRRRDGLHGARRLAARLTGGGGRGRGPADREAVVPALGLLDVRRVVARTARGDLVLARFGQHHELVGERTPDRSGVGFDGAEREAAPGEDPLVGLDHHAVLPLGVGLVPVKGVGVLHDELPAPHEAEAGTPLVTELGLDLVEVDGKLAVRADLFPDDVRHDLLVRRPEAEIAVVSVLETEKFLAVQVPPAALPPKLGRHDGGHQDLLRPRPVHLLPDDLRDLLDHAEADREVGVDSGRDLPDHPGAKHELVTDDLGFGGRFFDGGNEELGMPHAVELPFRPKGLARRNPPDKEDSPRFGGATGLEIATPASQRDAGANPLIHNKRGEKSQTPHAARGEI